MSRPRPIARRAAATAVAAFALAAGRPAAAQSNIVANGTFEGVGAGGLPASWFNANPSGGAVGLTQAAHTGTFGVYFNSFGPVGFDTPGYAALGQSLATLPGQTYTLSFWARNNSQATTANRMQVLFGGATVFDRMLTNTTYELFTVSGVAAAAATDLVFRSSSQGLNVLDDVTATAASTPPTNVVPEPGPWALLGTGLAVLAGAARRRRAPAA